MRNYRVIQLFSFFLLFVLFQNEAPSQENNGYSISGLVSQYKSGDAVILYLFDPVSQNRTPLDTSIISGKGTYALTFQFTEPDLFRVDFPGRQTVLLVIDMGQKNIHLNAEGKAGGNVDIKGSSDSEKLQGYEVFREESNTRLIDPANDKMREASKGEDKKAEIEAIGEYLVATEKHRKELLDYTSKHIGTSIALYGTMLRWTGDEEISRLEKLVSDFKAVHSNLKMTKVMEEKVARFKTVAIGSKAPPITEKDLSGKVLSLYNVKGKYTLIDFWASWCAPCVRQFPEMKQAYEVFKGKGFEIFSVSIDSREDRWKAASERYELPWPNVSDVKGWDSGHARAYNVTFIPFNLLIDSNGIIVAKNLHSLELYSRLTSLLGY